MDRKLMVRRTRQVEDVLRGGGLRRGGCPDEGELRGALLEPHEGPGGER